MELRVTNPESPAANLTVVDGEIIDPTEQFDEFIIDPNGKIIEANLDAAGVTSYSKKEVIGKSIGFLYDQTDRGNNIHCYDLEKAKNRNRLTTFGERLANNQRLFWARMEFFPSKTNDGRVKKISVKVFDIANVLKTSRKLTENFPFCKLPIPTRNGYVFVELPAILRCESELNYTIFHLVDGAKVIACRTMRQFEHVLLNANFLRIHKSDIINLRHLRSYSKASGGVVVMDDNTELAISRTFKQNLTARLNLSVFEKQIQNL
jgi:PAS domain S-box-containing protein